MGSPTDSGSGMKHVNFRRLVRNLRKAEENPCKCEKPFVVTPKGKEVAMRICLICKGKVT